MLALHAQGCSILCTYIQTTSVEAQAGQDAHPLNFRQSSAEYCLSSLHGAIGYCTVVLLRPVSFPFDRLLPSAHMASVYTCIFCTRIFCAIIYVAINCHLLISSSLDNNNYEVYTIYCIISIRL